MTATPRRAHVFLALARAMELATGAEEDFSLRALVLAMRLAEAAGFGEAALRHTFDQALLRYIGCNAETHLMSAFVEDEVALRRDVASADQRNPLEMLPILIRAMRGGAAPPGLFGLLRNLARAAELTRPVLEGHCEVAARLGGRLGLSAPVSRGLSQLYARWDG